VPVLVAVGYRPDGPPPVDLLAADPRHVVIRLGGLDRDALSELAATLAQTRLPCDTVDALAERTAGNPLFATELVRALVSARALDDPTAVAGLLPERVQQVISRRLSGLPDDVSDVVAVASVFEAEIDLAALGRVADLPDAELYDAVDSAVVAGVLTAAGPRLRFAHDLIRQTAAASLGTLRRAHLNARVADALGPSADPTLVARHLLGAAAVAPIERVVDSVLAAAGFANAHGGYDQATALLHQALRVLAAAPPSETRTHLEIRVRAALGLLHQLIDGYLADTVAVQVEAIVPLLGTVPFVREDMPAWWFWLSFALAVDPASPDVDRADELLADAPGALVVVEAHRGLAAMFSGDVRGARVHFERADRAAPPEGLPPLPMVDWDPMLGILAPLAMVLAMQDEPEAADAVAERAEQFAPPVQHQFAHMFLLQYRAWIAFERGDVDEADRHAKRVAELAKRRQFAEYEYIASRIVGWARAVRGDAAGVDLITGAVAAPGTRDRPGQTALLLAQAELALGRPEAAIRAVDRVLHTRQLGREVMYLADLWSLRAQAALAVGDRAAAESAVRKSIEVGEEQGYLTALRRARALRFD
jgi:tetratricopeptide (TPR) repeat protein